MSWFFLPYSKQEWYGCWNPMSVKDTSLCTVMRPLSLTITKSHCPQVHLCAKICIPEASGDSHGEKIRKATQRAPVPLVTDPLLS
jgi:hypothetical protein